MMSWQLVSIAHFKQSNIYLNLFYQTNKNIPMCRVYNTYDMWRVEDSRVEHIRYKVLRLSLINER